MKPLVRSAAAAAAVLLASPLLAQRPVAPAPQSIAIAVPWTNPDPVLQRIWDEGMNRSHLEPLAQSLMDSVGPRLTGSPNIQRAYDWAIRTYAGWGITARPQQYGTWRAWSRGYSHVDLVSPRVRTLEATMLAWSPGTSGPVTGGVLVLPEVTDSLAFRAWLPAVRGKYVLVSY